MGNDVVTAKPLSVEHLHLIESKVSNERKSVGLAYVLWFFLGLWGIHNFYLAKTKLALFQLLGGFFAVIVLVVSIAGDGTSNNEGSPFGGFAILVIVVWWLSFIVDLFLIPRRARLYSERLRKRYAAELTGGV